MTNAMTSGLDVYQGWETYQERLIQALSQLTPAQLDYRPAAHLRSIGDVCRHMIGARARWLYLALGLGSDTLPDFAQWDAKDMPERTVHELTDGLRATWAVLRDGLSAWTVADLAQTVPNTDPEPGEPAEFTRQWIIWHLIEHDLHHGGEISLMIGSQGLPGVDI